MEGFIRYLGHQFPNGTSHELSKYVYIAVSGGRPIGPSVLTCKSMPQIVATASHLAAART